MDNIKWTITNEYICGINKKYKTMKNKKIFGFDLDNTLVKTKSGKKFPIDYNDWILWHNNVKTKIKELYERGYILVIISNQKGISTGKINSDEWQTKITNIIKELDVPFNVFASIDNNCYRKPMPKFWDFINGNINKSKYCGDACGRKNDFSNSDYLFAQNLGLKFYSPEHLFLNEKEKLNKIKLPFDIKYTNTFNIDNLINYDFYKDTMVLMVGYPGCGKSFISKRICKNIEDCKIINRDALKTIARCKKECIQQCEKNKTVIIDNTNMNIKNRKIFIDIAKKYNMDVNVIILNVSFEQSWHQNLYRSLITGYKHVPKIAYYKCRKMYEEPTKGENINKIIIIQPQIIINENTKNIMKCIWIYKSYMENIKITLLNYKIIVELDILNENNNTLKKKLK